MPRPDRHRVTIELGELRSRVFDLARSQDVPASAVVRNLLATALSEPLAAQPLREQQSVPILDIETRVWLRMPKRDAETLRKAAQAHKVSIGAFVAGLAAGVPALTAGGPRVPDHVKALITSCAEMSTLSRDVRHLAFLLG